MTDRISDIVADSLEVKRRFFEGHAADVQRAADMIAEALKPGGKLLVFGNGGSAADAQHIAGKSPANCRATSTFPGTSMALLSNRPCCSISAKGNPEYQQRRQTSGADHALRDCRQVQGAKPARADRHHQQRQD